MTALIVGTDFKDGDITGACPKVEHQNLWIVTVLQLYRFFIGLIRINITHESGIRLIYEVTSCHRNLIGSQRLQKVFALVALKGGRNTNGIVNLAIRTGLLYASFQVFKEEFSSILGRFDGRLLAVIPYRSKVFTQLHLERVIDVLTKGIVGIAFQLVSPLSNERITIVVDGNHRRHQLCFHNVAVSFLLYQMERCTLHQFAPDIVLGNGNHRCASSEVDANKCLSFLILDSFSRNLE